MTPRGRGRVVVIDDDAVFCAVVQSALETDGFSVETATDGPAGIELITRTVPDVVVLDLKLRDADGLGVLVRLRAMGGPGRVPVVVLTAQDGTEDRERGRTMGADLYLTKPVDMQLLAWHLDEVLARNSHERVNPLAGLRHEPTIPRDLL